ncbi:lipase [Gordonia pseudamarae]|jgi:pimeloyl-ACP methyl ester carboxylesterase|uniref:Lipase n=2 Tax=Gordonia pseudamarae TaxID=2831662 RepID=A0ABX6ILY7_9ACTN|nr:MULTISPECIES: lipase family protein [Gordonia]MBD0021953.1 lipase [Gordonia sp. (in: high G+C Gram-positive bacteria)]QHN28056.1 lipase [Gordonia pseudamarae]QHN36918.1 lipase [Gordonia pseudamarae]
MEILRGGKARRRGLRMAAVLLAGAMTATVASVAAPDASAADFYTPPATIADKPGAILKTQSIPLLLQIPGVKNQWPGTAKKVMYTSRDAHNKSVGVTGTVIEPTAPWTGKGPRPTVVVGPGTIGQGDQCAPSKMMSFPASIDITKPSIGVNYTAPEMYIFLLNGVRVFVTDYIGMGTPGIHTYVNRSETGHAMLDGARAAINASGAPKNSPVGFVGYSQGGGAAASAAELAQTYAPELKVKATYAGAPPADLRKVLAAVDGTTISGVIGYAINGMTARYPALREVVDKEANASGKARLKQVSTQCIGDTILTNAFQPTNSWTISGRRLGEIADKYPDAVKVLEENRIGQLKPNAPVYLQGGLHDDVIPYGQVKDLYRNWKALGANVTFHTDATPAILTKVIVNHVVPMLTTLLPGTNFVLDHLRR